MHKREAATDAHWWRNLKHIYRPEDHWEQTSSKQQRVSQINTTGCAKVIWCLNSFTSLTWSIQRPAAWIRFLWGSTLRVKAVGVAELKRPTDTERRSKISITHQAFVRFVRRPSAASRALEEPDSRAPPENPAPLLFCAAITARLTDERLSVKSGLSVSECARLCRCQLRWGMPFISSEVSAHHFSLRPRNAPPQVKWLNVRRSDGVWERRRLL